MPRQARRVYEGLPHHVTQRGNRKQKTFADDEDRVRYLRLLLKWSRLYRTRVWAYALMDNHVHLICVPASATSLSGTLRDTHAEYATHFNSRHELTGHLWQGRFFSTALDDGHLRTAIRYVERNPVRAGLVTWAEQYRWSSAQAHCGEAWDPVLSPCTPLIGEVADWRLWLRAGESQEALETVRRHTLSGNPLFEGEAPRKAEAAQEQQIVRAALSARSAPEAIPMADAAY